MKIVLVGARGAAYSDPTGPMLNVFAKIIMVEKLIWIVR